MLLICIYILVLASYCLDRQDGKGKRGGWVEGGGVRFFARFFFCL